MKLTKQQRTRIAELCGQIGTSEELALDLALSALEAQVNRPPKSLDNALAAWDREAQRTREIIATINPD